MIATLALATGATTLRAADAQKLFEANCAECHGDDGKGKTKMGEKINLQMDFTDPKVQERLKIEDVVKAIKEGVTDPETKKKKMKPVEDLSDDDIKTLALYIRTFKK